MWSKYPLWLWAAERRPACGHRCGIWKVRWDRRVKVWGSSNLGWCQFLPNKGLMSSCQEQTNNKENKQTNKHLATRIIFSPVIWASFSSTGQIPMIPACWKNTWTFFYWLHKAGLQCECNISILTQWKSKRNQTNWPPSGNALLTQANCSAVCVCLCGCLSVNVWESNPGILFSGKAELQRWQMQLTRCLQMCLERPAWVTWNRLAQ